MAVLAWVSVACVLGLGAQPLVALDELVAVASGAAARIVAAVEARFAFEVGSHQAGAVEAADWRPGGRVGRAFGHLDTCFEEHTRTAVSA